MKPVIIKNIEIGKGLPKIAVPLVAANTQELEQALRVLKETAFDIIEFRADFFQAALDAYFIAEQLGIARQAFPDKPLLFTFRRAQEGGNTPCSDDYYFELLEKINPFQTSRYYRHRAFCRGKRRKTNHCFGA